MLAVKCLNCSEFKSLPNYELQTNGHLNIHFKKVVILFLESNREGSELCQ